jgi:hypothetical protein
MAAVLAGVAALVVYVLPGLPALAAHWPLWDVRVYWWGGRQAAAGGAALYAPGAPFSFTYPPFAAWLFSAGAHAPVAATKIAMTAGSVVALAAWRAWPSRSGRTGAGTGWPGSCAVPSPAC